MPNTIGFGKLKREMLSNERLPIEVRVARARFKQSIRAAGMTSRNVFENKEEGLPEPAVGQQYFEWQVGQATSPTASDPHARGKFRLVALVDPTRKVLRMYYTQEHYTPGQWMQLQYP